MKFILISSENKQVCKAQVSAYVAGVLDANGVQCNYVKLSDNLAQHMLMPLLNQFGEAFITHDGGSADYELGIVDRQVSYNISKDSNVTLSKLLKNIQEHQKDACFSLEENIQKAFQEQILKLPKNLITIIEVAESVQDIMFKMWLKAIGKVDYSIFIGSKGDIYTNIVGQQPNLLLSQEFSPFIPLNQGVTSALDQFLLANFKISSATSATSPKLLGKIAYPKDLTIAIVVKPPQNELGFYFLKTSLDLAGKKLHYRINIKFTLDPQEYQKADGIIVPGGIAENVNDRIKAIQYAREKNVPFLGICMGLQFMFIEFCQNVLLMQGAGTEEAGVQGDLAVVKKREEGPMLGQVEINLEEKASIPLGMSGIYNNQSQKAEKNTTSEKFCNSYVINMNYWAQAEKKYLAARATDPESGQVLAAQLRGKKFFVGTQFHPEFCIKVNSPHQIFVEFLEATMLK